MAGLNDLVTDTKTEATTLPSWYSTAQQDVINKALSAASPAVGQTVAQNAIDAFGSNSPFKAGTDILQQIGSGAANPWLVSTDATGKQTVSPNVNTAMGGLYQSQQDYMNQIMPQIDVAATTPAIAAGGFGSRMNLSGIANARANALADLQQKQMTNALQAQQTGVSAGLGLGNVGNQMVQSALNTGTYQQNAPYATPMNIANIVSKLQVPTTKTSSSQLGGLNQLLGLLSATSGGMSSLLGSTRTVNGQQVKIPGLLEQGKTLLGNITDLFSTAPTTGTEITNTALPGQEGYGWQYFSDGTVIDPSGQYYQNGQLVYSPYLYDYGSGFDDTGTESYSTSYGE